MFFGKEKRTLENTLRAFNEVQVTLRKSIDSYCRDKKQSLFIGVVKKDLVENSEIGRRFYSKRDKELLVAYNIQDGKKSIEQSVTEVLLGLHMCFAGFERKSTLTDVWRRCNTNSVLIIHPKKHLKIKPKFLQCSDCVESLCDFYLIEKDIITIPHIDSEIPGSCQEVLRYIKKTDIDKENAFIGLKQFTKHFSS